MNRRGIELSINFIVMLILSIVVFTGGLVLVKKFFSAAENKRVQLDDQQEAEIAKLLNDGSKVAIPIAKKDIKMGNQDIFGVGIYNVAGGTKDFYVSIKFSTAVDNNGDEIIYVKTHPITVKKYINDNWVFSKTRKYSIKNLDYQAIPILIKAGANIDNNQPTLSGTYIFNVNVSIDRNPPSSGPDELYDGHIHKIYVTVK